MGRYLAIWFGSSIAVIALVALANWQLDAYGYWGNAKAVYYSTERQFKASRIHHYPHDSLLLGTSRFAFIDPERLICGSYFNAAFSGATLAELVEFVERFVDHPRLVIVGLDFQMFDNSVEPNERGGFGRTPKDFAKHLLSLNMLYRGIVTKRLNLAGVQPKILGNGQRNAARLNREDAGLSGTSYDKKSLADVRNSFKNFRVITNAELLLTRLKSALLRRASRTIVVLEGVLQLTKDWTQMLGEACRVSKSRVIVQRVTIVDDEKTTYFARFVGKSSCIRAVAINERELINFLFARNFLLSDIIFHKIEQVSDTTFMRNKTLCFDYTGAASRSV